ncbi:MAG: MBL fold metallo-hydrolase, partial [Candidatus Heimdallarchaeota archaeon]
KEIKSVLNHFFSKNKTISHKTKKSISKIVYSKKDRIIIILTPYGKDIIINRDRLTKEYGWFFFISKSEKEEKITKKKKPKKKADTREEVTISTVLYHFEESDISLKQKENMRALYKTKEYNHYMKMIKSKELPQISIMEVLDDFFQKDKLVPIEEKRSIKKVIYYQKEKVIVIKSLIGDDMYENLERLVKKYGWYFYITGVPVGDSELCIAIDKIERRYDEKYFNSISLGNEDGNSKDIRVTIYPIVLKPNHNCHILGLGKLNILLDCGLASEKPEEISEEVGEGQEVQVKHDFMGEEEKGITDEEEGNKGDMRHINEYLQNLHQLILEEERKKNEESDLITDDLSIISLPQNPKIDAIFISHSHWDHISGLKELIKLYPDIPILSSRITLDLYLLRDSNFLKQETYDEIEEEIYRNIVKNVIYVENGTKIEFKEKKCFLSFFHAGHMPGALMMLAKVNDFRILYTGDYTYHDITPFAGTRRFLEQISRPIDYLLIDGTAAQEDFGNISDQFHSLILFLEQKAEYGDNSLIGADPSSLAISFMLTFWRYFRKLQLRRNYKNRPNIYVDMMVRRNIQVINHRYEFIYGPISRLIRDKANPFNSIKFRWFDQNSLDFLRKKNNIIISHPPDLSYGLIRNIINSVGRSPHNFVFLAGSIHESPGIELLEGAEEIEFSETWKVPFRAFLLNTFAPNIKIKLHADKNQLREMIKVLEPKEVCFFHQSAKRLIDIVEYVKELGVEKVSLPKKRKLTILN